MIANIGAALSLAIGRGITMLFLVFIEIKD